MAEETLEKVVKETLITPTQAKKFNVKGIDKFITREPKGTYSLVDEKDKREEYIPVKQLLDTDETVTDDDW